MKLYAGFSPSSLRAEIFVAEKGMDIETVSHDLLKGETRTPAFLAKNSLGEVPFLELDDGSVITESVALCRYLESVQPAPPLFGIDPISQARTEMWNRRIEIKLFATVGGIGLHEFEFFKDHVEQFPDYAASLRRTFAMRLAWLNQEMSDGRAYVAGDDFSVADITGMAMLLICSFAEIEIPGELVNVKAWEERLRSRPSWLNSRYSGGMGV